MRVGDDDLHIWKRIVAINKQGAWIAFHKALSIAWADEEDISEFAPLDFFFLMLEHT